MFIIKIPATKPRNHILREMIQNGIGKAKKFRHRAERRAKDARRHSQNMQEE